MDERPAKRVMGRHRGGSSAERAAILRDLDEEIRRRDDELRLTKEEVGGSPPDTTRPRPPAPRVRGAAAEDSSITAEELRAGLFKLAGRVEALEESLRETQRQNWEELRAEQDPLKGRLAALEKAFETGAQGLAGMIERLSARLDTAIGELKGDQRAQRNRLNAIRDSHQQTRDQHERELRALRESVTKRLARLEEIVVGGDGDHGAVEKRLRETLAKLSARTQLAEMIETQLAATIEKLTEFESLDARLRRAEERAVADDEPLTDGGGRNADDDLEPIGGRLDLNDASCDQLRELGLSVTQATRLIAQREAHGPFTSTGELDQVPGFAAPQLEELKRRVYVEPAANR